MPFGHGEKQKKKCPVLGLRAYTLAWEVTLVSTDFFFFPRSTTLVKGFFFFFTYPKKVPGGSSFFFFVAACFTLRVENIFFLLRVLVFILGVILGFGPESLPATNLRKFLTLKKTRSVFYSRKNCTLVSTKKKKILNPVHLLKGTLQKKKNNSLTPTQLYGV
jgi:hypothetical protein